MEAPLELPAADATTPETLRQQTIRNIEQMPILLNPVHPQHEEAVHHMVNKAVVAARVARAAENVPEPQQIVGHHHQQLLDAINELQQNQQQFLQNQQQLQQNQQQFLQNQQQFQQQLQLNDHRIASLSAKVDNMAIRKRNKQLRQTDTMNPLLREHGAGAGVVPGIVDDWLQGGDFVRLEVQGWTIQRCREYLDEYNVPNAHIAFVLPLRSAVSIHLGIV